MYIRRKTSKEIANMVPPSDGIFQNVDAVVVLYYMTVAYVWLWLPFHVESSCNWLNSIFCFEQCDMKLMIEQLILKLSAICQTCHQTFIHPASDSDNKIFQVSPIKYASEADTGVYFSTILKFFIKDKKVS